MIQATTTIGNTNANALANLNSRMGMCFARSRCELCPRRPGYGIVKPSGPVDSPILLVGEGPAKNEDRLGAPFVGNTGKELDMQYLPLAGIDRSQVRVTNAVKCSCYGYANPGRDLAMDCATKFLAREIEIQKPKVIVLMGGVACSLVPDLQIEYHHGTPIDGELFGHECWIFPTYHPAIGMHDTRFMTFLRADFQALGRFLNGQWFGAADPFEGAHDYRRLETPGQVRATLPEGRIYQLAIDTEFDREGFWCLSYCLEPGSGYMIAKQDTWALLELFNRLRHDRPLIGVHNYLADVEPLHQAGFDLPDDRFLDTMAGLYQLQSHHLGLKGIAARMFGMRMSSFEDVVMPHSRLKAVEYLAEAEERLYPQPYLGKRQWRINRKIGSFLKAYFDPAKSTPCPYERWRQWSDLEHETVERYNGPWPEPTIDHAPLAESVPYACADADATLRLMRELPWLLGRTTRQAMRWEITSKPNRAILLS